MKFFLLAFFVLIFLFLSIGTFCDVFAEDQNREENGIISGIKFGYRMVVDRIFSFKDSIVNQIRYRQEVVEKEVEKRKSSFAQELKARIADSINSVAESLIETIRRPFGGGQEVDR